MNAIRKHLKIRARISMVAGITPAVTGSGMAIAAIMAPGSIAGQPSLFFAGIAVAMGGTVAVMAISTTLEWFGLID